MEIIRELSVSKEEFFRYLLKSVQHDYKENTNIDIAMARIKRGLQYKKEMDTKDEGFQSVSVKICDIKENETYKAEFSSELGQHVIAYEIDELNNKGIQVHYKEEYRSQSRLSEWNQKIMSLFFKRDSQKKMEQLLSGIESYIIQNRK